MTRKAKTEPAPVPRFVGAGAFRVVPLSVPVEFEGKVYNEVTVKRMTMAELRAFIDAVTNTPDEASLACMVDCPIDLLDNLFPDDFDDVQEAIGDFLPRRLREASEAKEPVSTTGETTSPSSPPNSDGPSPT